MFAVLQDVVPVGYVIYEYRGPTRALTPLSSSSLLACTPSCSSSSTAKLAPHVCRTMQRNEWQDQVHYCCKYACETAMLPQNSTYGRRQEGA
jgi:hypothetical protein